MRALFLWAAGNRWLATHVPRWRFARRAVKRFLPGEGFEAALKAATDFKTRGVGALFTLLGENVTDLADANRVVEHYEEVLAASAGVEAEVSVKPTQLGLDIDPDAAYANLLRLARAASNARSFLWIDMEGSAYTERTLDLYKALRSEHANVGVALQAYLHRTVSDVATLLPLKPAIRLVKGAYAEPPEIAFMRKRDVFADLFDRMYALRQDTARNAGFANYRDFAHREKNRFDYTPDDCMRFHAAVEEAVVPAITW